MDIATKFASGQEAVEAIFQKDKQPQGRQQEDVHEASAQRSTKKKSKNKAQAKRDAADADLVAVVEHRNPRKLPEGPTCSIRCSRSRAPITRVPSSTPLRNASCFGATSIRSGPGGRWQRPRQQQERGRQGRGVPRGSQLLHDLRWANGERLGSAPQAGAPGGLLGKGGSASLPRLVRQAHHFRPRRPPRLRAEPRKVPARCRSCHWQR
jgi:hypothetical protein